MYRPGEWKAVCDMCGLQYLASQLFEDYRGLRVCKKDLETRHPQEFVRPRVERIGPPWTRVDDNESEITIDDDGTAVIPTDPFTESNIIYFDFDALGGLDQIGLCNANDSRFSGQDFTFLLVNMGETEEGVISPPAGFVGSATVLPQTTAKIRNIYSQNIWIRDQ
jgi:hypothetical protein